MILRARFKGDKLAALPHELGPLTEHPWGDSFTQFLTLRQPFQRLSSAAQRNVESQYVYLPSGGMAKVMRHY